MGIPKEFEYAKARLSKSLINYEARYIKSEDGIIGLELAILADKELDRLLNRCIKLITQRLLEK